MRTRAIITKKAARDLVELAHNAGIILAGACIVVLMCALFIGLTPII